MRIGVFWIVGLHAEKARGRSRDPWWTGPIKRNTQLRSSRRTPFRPPFRPTRLSISQLPPLALCLLDPPFGITNVLVPTRSTRLFLFSVRTPLTISPYPCSARSFVRLVHLRLVPLITTSPRLDGSLSGRTYQPPLRSRQIRSLSSSASSASAVIAHHRPTPQKKIDGSRSRRGRVVRRTERNRWSFKSLWEKVPGATFLLLLFFWKGGFLFRIGLGSGCA